MGYKILEMNAHRAEVPGYQDAPSVSSHLQNYRIARAVRNHPSRRSDVYSRLSAQQTPPNIRVEVRVRLKVNLQASLAD